MKVTYYGHSCFLINIGKNSILFDPFISQNPLAKKIDINSIKTDYILISHGHEDHIADAITIAKKTNATVLSNYEIICWIQNQGVTKVHPLNHGGKVKLEFGYVKFVNAVHSSMLPDGSYGGNPGGFVITSKKNCIYYAGDTALTYDMKLIGESNKVDIAFLPIGDNFTMDIDDALICSNFVKCDKVIGMHYDTFELIEINKNNAEKSFLNIGKSIDLLNIGETKTY